MVLKARPVMETTARWFLELGRMQRLHTSSTPSCLYQQRFTQAIPTTFSPETYEGYPTFPMNFLPLKVLNHLPNHWFPELEGLTDCSSCSLKLFSVTKRCRVLPNQQVCFPSSCHIGWRFTGSAYRRQDDYLNFINIFC